MKVRFWGVRGSIPVPGHTTNRYGGNTSCVEVTPRDGPPIIIDAGTGIRHLGKTLMQGQLGDGRGSAHLLISHTHWDHIQGLPFFSPLYKAGNELHVYARQRDDTHLRAIFASQTEGPYFPVPLSSLKAAVNFRELVEGQQFAIGEASIRCTRLNHPWIAMAYRVDVDGASVVYASDTAPFDEILMEHEFIANPPEAGARLRLDDKAKLTAMRDGLVDLCKGTDLLIYDTQFSAEEYRLRPHWGHSTPEDAIHIAAAAKVKKLALFHHAPARTDDQIDAILRALRVRIPSFAEGGFDIVAAHEGLEQFLGETD